MRIFKFHIDIFQCGFIYTKFMPKQIKVFFPEIIVLVFQCYSVFSFIGTMPNLTLPRQFNK